MLTRYSAII